MAPNSAMKVPVFPILLSPSSPQISPTGLRREGREGGGGGGQEERQAKGRKTQKRGTNKRAITTSALEHLKH